MKATINGIQVEGSANEIRELIDSTTKYNPNKSKDCSQYCYSEMSDGPHCNACGHHHYGMC